MGAEGKTFLQFVEGLGNGPLDSHFANLKASDPDKWKKTGENEYTWKPGTAMEQVYDFSPFFPVGERARVDRLEGYLFALYEHRGGTGEFVPYGDEDE